jgi:hypothetical protein
VRFRGFRAEHLRHVGWQAYRVTSYAKWVRARPGGDPRPRSGWLAQLVVGWLVTCSCGWEWEASFGTTRSPDLPAAGVTDMRSALLRQWSLANGARENVQGCVAL